MNEDEGVTYGSEMHDAVVKEVAQWICRQCLGVDAKGTDRQKIVAHTRMVLANPHLRSDGDAASLSASAVATEAEALADKHMETDVNWDQWAFGH